MKPFNVPIALFSFVREDKILQIIEKIRKIEPTKIYLISDGGRNEIEHDKVLKCRQSIENSIDWNCKIIKRYSSVNIGVFNNIAGGAKWVFSQEDSAIFLEDDNLPALSFFPFCADLLNKYKDNDRILWICGTNYLGEYETSNNESYLFSKNMMPCGWASWSNKFLKYYNEDFSLWKDRVTKKNIHKEYLYFPLFIQDTNNWNAEIERFDTKGRYASWDYQMSLSIRAHKLYGIVPKYNQINNIGVDEYSIHGGNSNNKIMTSRFCNIPTRELEFPLNHPKEVVIDKRFELKTEKIITYPWLMRVKFNLSYSLKRLFKIYVDNSLIGELKKRYIKNK